MVSTASQDEEAFLQAVRETPIIDNHAHPLLRRTTAGKFPLVALTTEADGSALSATPTSLAHLRAVKQLSRVLGCAPTLEQVQAAIDSRRKNDTDYDNWTTTCLEGIHTVLVDDLIGNEDDLEKYDYFDRFTPGKSKRIVRIEHVATNLIEKACLGHTTPEASFSYFMETLNEAISRDIVDPQVVGFKSAICYRTGLAIPLLPDEQKAFAAFEQIHTERQQANAKPFSRLQHDGLNEYVVHRLATLIAESAHEHLKPIQFHTGLGDNDITLTKASPAHLQQLIKRYPTVPMVLLHSGYPFVREMGYMATVYSNVYADIGEVFPMVSREGQEGIVRQMLEVCPTSKILWSTDGHWLPETYLLAVIQIRQTFETVFSDYVRKDDLTWLEAKQFVEDMFFNNSNKLYDLKLSMDSPSTILTPQTEPDMPVSGADNLAKLMSVDSSAKFVRVCWHDMTGTTRARTIPIRHALSLLESGKDFKLSISKTALAVLQADSLVEGASPAGEWDLYADFACLRKGPRPGYVTAMGNFFERDGTRVGLCPRTTLIKTLELASSRGLSFIFGFEIEFVLLKRSGTRTYDILDSDTHAWSTVGACDYEPAALVIEDAIAKLDEAGVYVEATHSESAFGQYEIVLPAVPALEAVDTLLYARQVISSCANAHGYKMTLHPKPFLKSAGTAAHAHLSISTSEGSKPQVYEPFYAGILKHLRAIMAYTCPNPVSYARIVDGYWAGGTWVTWGSQNRETPLRKVEGSHWELKCMDGLANPYLAMAAVLASGLDGVIRQEPFTWKECTGDPATLTQAQREELHINTKLPSSLEEALESLKQDEDLQALLGREGVDRYLNVKQGEISMLGSMYVSDLRQWIIERY